MAGASERIEIPFKAGEDLSSYQYRGVYISADDTVKLTAAANKSIGILQDKPSNIGQGARVVVLGRTRAIFSGSVTVNDEIALNSTGYIISAVSGTDFALGICTKAANSGYPGEVVLGVGAGPAILT